MDAKATDDTAIPRGPVEPTPSQRDDRPGQENVLSETSVKLLMMALASSAVIILTFTGVLAILRLNTYYRINQVSGAWMSLAKYADSGILYPPLYDGRFYGGTRFMPLTILLNAGAGGLTGEYLVSGKLIALLCMLLLLALTFVILRQLGCSIPVSLALTGAVLATVPGLDATFSIRGDALAVLWQLAAVSWTARTVGRTQELRYAVKPEVVTATLCVLAVLSKLSAVWGAMAVCIWLLIRDRRAFLIFCGAFAILLLAALGVLQIASRGHMLESILGLLFAGAGQLELISRAQALGHDTIEAIRVIWVLVPVALLGTVMAARRRELTIYHVSLICAVVVTLVVYTDVGVVQNHLLDVVVLTVVVVGDFLARSVRAAGAASTTTHVLVALLLLWVVPTTFVYNLISEDSVHLDYGKGTQRSMGSVLAGHVHPTDRILSEDPTVSVGLGQLPMVLDPFMLLRIRARHPEWIQGLADRVQNREFNKIVLVDDLSEPGFGEEDFGPEVVARMRRNYRLAAHIRDYYIYEPVDAARSYR